MNLHEIIHALLVGLVRMPQRENDSALVVGATAAGEPALRTTPSMAQRPPNQPARMGYGYESTLDHRTAEPVDASVQ